MPNLEFSDLTEAQQRFLAAWSSDEPDTKLLMADYLRQSAPCSLGNYSGPLPFKVVLRICDNPDFWVDCFAVEDEARAAAATLGLPLVAAASN